MGDFRDLLVWQKANELVLEVYKITKKYPNEEKFVLTSQIRRAAISIPASIVEGFKRRGDKEFGRFLNVAEGSLEETKYYLILSSDLGYLTEKQKDDLFLRCKEAGRMITGLRKKLNT